MKYAGPSGAATLLPNVPGLGAKPSASYALCASGAKKTCPTTGSIAAASDRERRRSVSSSISVAYGHVRTTLPFSTRPRRRSSSRAGDASAAELIDAAIARIERINPELNAVIHKRYDRARDEASRGPRSVRRCALSREGRGVPHRRRSVPLRHARPEGFQLGRIRRHVARNPLSQCRVRVRRQDQRAGARDRQSRPSRSRTARRTIRGTSSTAPADRAAGRRPRSPRAWFPSRTATTWVARSASRRACAASSGSSRLRRARRSAPTSASTGDRSRTSSCLTRSVRDTARVLDCVAGAGTGDPYTAPPPLRAVPRGDHGSVTTTPRRRSGVTPPSVRRIPTASPRSSWRRSCSSSSDTMSRRRRSTRSMHRMGDGFFHAMTVGIANDVARWSRRLGRDISTELEPMNLLFAQLGSSVTAQQYVAALDDAQAWSRGVAAWWEDHDVLVLPVEPRAARTPGRDRARQPRSRRQRSSHASRAVHMAVRRHRPARDLAAVALERRRAPDRCPTRRRVRT